MTRIMEGVGDKCISLKLSLVLLCDMSKRAETILTREHTISGEIVRVCLRLPLVSWCLLISTIQCVFTLLLDSKEHLCRLLVNSSRYLVTRNIIPGEQPLVDM